jgi:hypothetical protein
MASGKVPPLPQEGACAGLKMSGRIVIAVDDPSPRDLAPPSSGTAGFVFLLGFAAPRTTRATHAVRILSRIQDLCKFGVSAADALARAKAPRKVAPRKRSSPMAVLLGLSAGAGGCLPLPRKVELSSRKGVLRDA